MLGAMAITMSSTVMTKPEEAEALGPVKIALVDPEYGSVVCPPKTQVKLDPVGDLFSHHPLRLDFEFCIRFRMKYPAWVPTREN